MRKNKERMLARNLLVLSLWAMNGLPVFAAERSLMTASPALNQASILTQTGNLNVLAYIAVGVVMAGFGFMVRKKI